MWKVQPTHDSPRAFAGLKEKCYDSIQKISQPISSQKSFVTTQKIFFLSLLRTILCINRILLCFILAESATEIVDFGIFKLALTLYLIHTLDSGSAITWIYVSSSGSSLLFYFPSLQLPLYSFNVNSIFDHDQL